MNESSGSISYEALLNNKQFMQEIRNLNNSLMSTGSTAKKATNEISDAFNSLAIRATGLFAFSELAQLPKKLIDVRGEFQQLEIAFETMLGSKAKADKLFAQVVQLAATTPFDLKSVATGAKQLLAYGVASEEISGTLTRLGDIAAGLSIPLNDLTYLYGTTKTQGRLFAQDLNQFVQRGIPLIKLLADQFKVAESEVRGLVEQGKVGFPEVEKAINTLTESGGMFAGLMEKQSKSLTGLYSNFQDAVEQAFNKIGKEQEGILAGSIKMATTVVENYEPILDTLKVLVATYGAYKAAVIATAAVQSLAAAGPTIKVWWDLAKSIRSAADAQALFNLTTKANPYAIAAAALMALVTAVALFSKESNEATKARERSLEISEKLNQRHADELTKVQLLAKEISNEALTRDQRNAKLKELIALSPEHFKALSIDAVATDKGAEAIRAYTKALEHKLEIQAREEQILANNKRIRDINTGVLDDEFKPNVGERALLFLQDKDTDGFTEKHYKAELEKRKKIAVKALEDQNEALLKEAAEGADKIEKVSPTTPTAKPEKAKKEAKAESQERIKTFAEEIEEKKNLYALYQKWVEYYGQQAANEQFSTLIAQNKTYVDYLDGEIKRLEAVKNSGEMSYSDASDLDNLIVQKQEATGGKSAIEIFKDELDQARESADTLTDYLETLKRKQAELSGAPDTDTNKGKKLILTQDIIGTEADLKNQLKTFFTETASFTQKRLQIEKRYDNLRKTARETQKGQELDQALKQIEVEKKAEIDSINDQESDKKESLRKIQDISLDYGRKYLREEIRNIQKRLAEEKISAEKRAELERNLANLKNNLTKDTTDGIRTAAGVLGSVLGDVTLNLTSQLKVSIKDLAGVANDIANVMDFDASSASASDYAGAIGSIVGIHSYLITTVRDAFARTEDFYTGLEDGQKYYEDMAHTIEGVNILLDRQRKLLDDLQGVDHSTGVVSLMDNYTSEQEATWKRLKALSIDVIKSQKEVFVDPILGTEVENKGFWGVYTQLATAGKAKTVIKYQFENVDTSGYDDIEDYRKLLADIKSGGGKLDGKVVAEADVKALEELIQQYDDLIDKQKALKDEFDQFLTGTTVDGIAQALVDGFANGKKSAADFAGDFEDMMKKAIMNSLTAQITGKQLTDFYAKYADYAASNNSLDQSEINDLKKDWDTIVQTSLQAYDNMQQITGQALTSSALANKSLTGSIQGMSEETASVLAGQFNALRITQADSLMVCRNQLFELTAIKANTGATVEELRIIKRDIATMAAAMKSDPLRAAGG